VPAIINAPITLLRAQPLIPAKLANVSTRAALVIRIAAAPKRPTAFSSQTSKQTLITAVYAENNAAATNIVTKVHALPPNAPLQISAPMLPLVPA